MKSRGSIRTPLAVLALLLCLSPPSGARQVEEPQGDLASGFDQPGASARSTGRVVDRTGTPVAGVTVTLTSRAGGPPIPALKTDDKGRWSTPPIPAGRYDIVLEKQGFMPSEGFVDVDGRVGEETFVELRSLDVVTPSFAESNPEASVRAWIDTANELLEQGESARARAEYEKALRYVQGGRRAEVLRAVARTHYLESDVDRTIESLVAALEAAPTDVETRSLYSTLMSQLERAAEAEAVLEALDAAPPPAPSSSAASSSQRRPAPPIPEAVDAEAHRTGARTVRFRERSPLNTPERIFGAYGLRADEVREMDPDALSYDLAEESFDLIVPEGYDGSTEWGLVVWISPTPRGGFRGADVLDLLEERKLIWVGANRAGNPRPKWDRIGLALDAAHNVAELYSIDADRVVVGGYSGGGRTAASAVFGFPEVFGGVICWFGTDYFRPIPVAYQPGHSWPAAFLAPPKKVLHRLERTLGVALVTGELDFNRAETAAVSREMEKDRFRRVRYLEIPGADHYHGLDAEWLGRALDVVAPFASD